jgi:glutaminyl-tRNA synthetase
VRVFNPLFNVDNPDSHPDEGYLSIINPKSERIFRHAMVETGFGEIRRGAPWPSFDGEKEQIKETAQEARPETVRFQGMRVGYFCVDKETETGKLVLNRIVSLKEDPKKA